ncbi:hypothetical protein [Desulfosporosinus shakirovi]|uniref:hypothetical protein n=1 Tax=Desulfosporosinus shakirovi TaxID=2885154 RepID=UPI001E49629E|nr:hypothetical protein [Desulfosporosinus sp. SRJS8]MCB8818533.1 hypothetical protein [Desulfosporosinus sp. SRJS8]
MFTREEVIEAMEQCLNEKEKEILSARWGITTGISIRFEEINEVYGITIEQMRDIERRVSLHIKEYR